MTARYHTPRHQRGSALIVVLWSIAILVVVVVGLGQASTLELRVTKNHADSVQAYYLALAGVEKAKALIYHQTRGTGAGSDFNDSLLYDSASDFRDVELGRGRFSVVRAPRSAGGSASQGERSYGVVDNESRLNVNVVGVEELSRLRDMTPELAAAIVDWRDDDDKLTEQGAESEFYRGQRPPYEPRNAAFETLEELLAVRGMTPRKLFGEDSNRNGVLDPEENDGDANPPMDNEDGVLYRGLSPYLTTDSGASDINRRGEPRVDVQLALPAELERLPGVTSAVARAIVEHRSGKNLESLADLLEVRAPASPDRPPEEAREGNRDEGERRHEGERGEQPVVREDGAGEERPRRSRGSPREGGNSDDEPKGPPLIDTEMLIQFADDVTVGSDSIVFGAININTASRDVLACLTGLNEELADAIVSFRQSSGGFRNVAEITRVEGVTNEIFKGLVARICTRGGTFLVVSEGFVPSTGARRRIEATVRMGDFGSETLHFRENP